MKLGARKAKSVQPGIDEQQAELDALRPTLKQLQEEFSIIRKKVELFLLCKISMDVWAKTVDCRSRIR